MSATEPAIKDTNARVSGTRFADTPNVLDGPGRAGSAGEGRASAFRTLLDLAA